MQLRREVRSLTQQHAVAMATCQQQEIEIQRLRREKDRVSRQPEESERVIAQFQGRIAELEQVRPATDTTSSSRRRERIKMTWRKGRKVPIKCNSPCNAVTDGTTVYIRTRSTTVHAYTTSTSAWSQLPENPTIRCPPVIINNLLTLVGGAHDGLVPTNQLFSLTGEGRGRRWKEVFPAMSTKRWRSTALCTGTALIVAGGETDRGRSLMRTVEVMDTETLQWSTAADLPQPLSKAPGAVCGDHVYILSLWGGLKSMYTCSVSALLQSCRSRPTAGVWNTVAAPPVTHTTCVSTHGRLLAIGGRDSNNKPTAAIYMYDRPTDSWEVISHMTTPRYLCYAAVLLNNQLMVVGGITKYGETDSVEIATVE